MQAVPSLVSWLFLFFPSIPSYDPNYSMHASFFFIFHTEITSQHVVPLGYLITLMVLFGFVVADRVVYTLGSPAGKAFLHLAEMGLLFAYCSTLVWAPSSGTGFDIPTGALLACFLALKAGSFALSSLQLRSGYPPPASYANGMGRHTFVFMRSISISSSLAFHAFTAVPFLYEMRQLLDWACTPTTLTLYDWLKLEDINVSLYFAAVMRHARAGRPLGVRQPRYLKFFQGTLLFAALIVLLWVPLLLFSSGNPTYQVPTLQTFSGNVTLQASGPHAFEGGLTSVVTAPLFRGGQRGLWVPWIGTNTTLPQALVADYTPAQLQKLCLPPDADVLWQPSPPTQRGLQEALADPDGSAVLSFGWNVLRDVPPPSEHGGPGCTGALEVPLAPATRQLLVEVLEGSRLGSPVQLMRAVWKGEDRGKGEANATTALFPTFWLLRGDACIARPLRPSDVRPLEALPGRRTTIDLSWTDRWMACNASLVVQEEKGLDQRYDTERWWRFECRVVDLEGNDAAPLDIEDKRAQCPRGFFGPSVVLLLDRVQGGILGATLNKFGVIGLYSVFVYGIGRFFRLGITNLRMRIPYEDLPTTRRLVSLCQDIYIARAEGLLELEEELYNALLSVYRLPSMMFELTKKEN